MDDTQAARTAPHALTRPKRFENLDGLRGVAALIVLIYHGVMVVPQFANPEFTGSGAGSWGWFDYSPLRVVLSGTEGVLVFFVLSGFVLTLPVLRTARYAWRAYYPSRLLRLYLPVGAALIWTVLVIVALPRNTLADDPSLYLQVHAEPLTALKVARDAVLVDGVNDLNGPLWSLQWEVIFSLLLPLYVILAVRLRQFWLSLVFVLAAVAAGATVAGIPSVTYLPAFAIGALFAAALPRVENVVARLNTGSRPKALWLTLSVVATLLLTARWTLDPILAGPWLGTTMFAVLLGAALFVFIAMGSAGAKRILTTPVVKWLGMISFSLYLTHEPIVIGIAQLLPRELEQWSVVLSAPISVLVAWLFFRFVEKPSHRLSQLVKRGLTPRS